MTGVQAQAAKLLEQIKSMSFSAAQKKGMHLDIGKMEVLQMALEKQVPKKPDDYMITNDNREILYQRLCAICGYGLGENVFDYCPRCGQRIDWRNK